MADSSAIDDTAAEARDLLLGDMATHVLDDVNGRIHASVRNFHGAFFPEPEVDGNAHENYVLAQTSLKKQPLELWKHWAAPFVKRTFVDDIFTRLKDMPASVSKKYVGRDDPRLESLEFQGKPDFVLVPKQPNTESRPVWYDVQALGSVREATSSGYQQGFLQLCGQAQTVFQHQPTRRFLHAFSVYGFTLEFFIFDRAGVISSEPADLHTDFVNLLENMYHYASMSDEQLGVGSFIKNDDGGAHVQLGSNDRNTTQKFYVDDEPLAWPANLLTKPGAFCLQARTPGSSSADVVVKFIWESEEDRHEISILGRATELGVWGVPHVLGYDKLASTRNIREAINLGVKRKVPPQSVQRPSLGEDMIAGMDRAASAQLPDYFDVNKNCLQSSTVEIEPSTGQDSAISSRSSEEFSLSCLATAPHGRSLGTFESISEALYALRDAVKAHRSLYNDGRLLHCDISRNNIIIPDFVPGADSPRGILIDFDECVEVDAPHVAPDTEPTISPATQVVEIRGTRAFIAIGLMRGDPHTYRHDLESFLYVLVHLAISRHAPDPPMTSRLNAWQTLDPWPELAAKKLGMVADDKTWRMLLAEFTPSFEPYVWLADELRALLFKTGQGGVFLGTEEGEDARNQLYQGVIDAFGKAIHQAEQA